MDIIKKIFKIILLTITTLAIILTLAFNLTLLYVDKHIDERIPKNVYNDCHKMWSSRGIYNTRAEQNTLLSLDRAIKAGHIGFEIDFYYDSKMDRFIISHDRPTKDKDGNLHYTLKNGRLLTLKEVFEKFGKGRYFWLDYKNLDRISKEESLKAVKRLEKISKIHNMKERVYIEGCKPWMLSFYDKKGFKTLLSFHPLPKSYPFHSASSNFFKMVYYFSSSTALALEYGKLNDPKYTKTTKENLKNIPQFIFHVPPKEKLLKKLVKEPDIRVLLAGKGESVDFGYITNCK